MGDPRRAHVHEHGGVIGGRIRATSKAKLAELEAPRTTVLRIIQVRYYLLAIRKSHGSETGA